MARIEITYYIDYYSLKNGGLHVIDKLSYVSVNLCLFSFDISTIINKQWIF